METDSISRRYETRRNARAKEPIAKSRVDWRRTKGRSRLLDSEEEDDDVTSASEKELEASSESEVDEKENDNLPVDGSRDETVLNISGHPDVETGCSDATAEDVEEESISLGKRKRSRSSVMYDSDESSDSDIIRKVFAKRKCIIDEEDGSAEPEQCISPTEEAAKRKQKRLLKLQELSQRQSTRTGRVSECHEGTEDDVVIIEDSSQTSNTPSEISNASEGDSMKDFITDDEEGEEQEQSEEYENQPQEEKQTVSSTLLEYYIPSLTRIGHFDHFQRVVKAFLINSIDDTFLISLYAGERQKRYAKDMLTSLHYLDDRFIQPRLENLLSRSRWKERYRERVDSYPDVQILLQTPMKRCCQACELQRYCKYTVILSGKSYNGKTLEIDDFMSHDKQTLKVGTVCGDRTRVYHNLKHFKYKLYRRCCIVMKKDKFWDEPVKDTVERVFSQLKEDDWIRKQYTDLEVYMNDADFFQEEKMD